MKTTTGLLIAGAALVGLMYFGNLGVASNVLQYYIQSVDFTGITTGRIILMVQNPSNATIVLNSMAGTISANGTTLGNISNFQGGITVPANNQVGVQINFAVSLSGILGSLYTVLTSPNGATPLDFVISGNANINGGIIVPFTLTQTVTV